MAYIRERTVGVWEIEVSTGLRDAVSGKYGTVSRTYRTGATRLHAGANPPRAVQSFADQLAVEVRQGKGRGTASTIEVLLDRYLEHQEQRGRAPKTMLEYRRLARGVCAATIGPDRTRFGDIELRRLTAEHVDQLIVVLKNHGTQGRPLSETSCHHHFALLSQALNQAVKWEWIDRNRAKAAAAPSLRAEEREPPTPAELQALLAHVVESKDLASLIFVAATTGCRRGELCGLRWRSVDLTNGIIVIEEAISDLPARVGGPVVKDTKNHLKRPMAIDEVTVAVLEVQRARAEEHCRDQGDELSPDAYVWSQEGDHTVPWRPSRVTDAFMSARNAAGLPHVQLKDVRHYVSTQLLGAGFDVKTVAGRQGHDAVMTLRVYGHRIKPRDQAAAKILGALLTPPAPVAPKAAARPRSAVRSAAGRRARLRMNSRP